MGDYVLIYIGGEQPATEEAQAADMDAWMAWFSEIGPVVVDGGNPFGPAASIAPDGTVSSGSASRASGYSIIRADSLEAATALASGCPHLQANGTIEVYETFDVM
jgi:hypothetical protein